MRSIRLAAVWTVLTIAILGMTCTAGSSLAHLPVYQAGGSTMSTAFKIPDANVSYGITAEFSSYTDRIQFYSFSVEAGQILSFELDVPAISTLQDFAPVILLIGPGLSAADTFTEGLANQLNIVLSPGDGLTSYLYNGTENVKVFEPFTQTNLWVRQSAEVTLPFQAVYYLAVAVPQGWANDATSGFGKYVLAPGTVEKFTIPDYMSIPLSWIRWHAFWGQSVLLFMLPTFLVVVVGTSGTWYYLRKRRSGILQDKPSGMKIGFYLATIGAMLIIGSTINQLGLLFAYTKFSLGTADYIELMLQSIGLLLGILAFRMAFSSMRSRSTASGVLSVVLAVLVVFTTLTVGAGWLVGPILFACGVFAELLSAHKTELRTSESGN